MIPYLIIIILALLSSILAIKQANKFWLFSWIGIIAISLIIGLRYNTGIDWLHFDECYRRIVLGYTVDIEFGFRALSLFFGKILNFNSWTIFTIMALCFVFPLYFVGKDNKKILFILVPLFICLHLTNSLTVSRQYAAMGILLCSFKYLKNNEIKKYVVCCIIALSFHSTSLMFSLLFFILYRIKWIKRHFLIPYLVLFLVTIYLSNFADSIFTYIYDNLNFIAVYVGKDSYVDNISIWADQVGLLEDADTPFRKAMSYLSTLLLIYYGDKFLKKHDEKPYYFIYHVSVIGLIIYPTFQSQELLKRIIWYFTVFSPFMYALILKEYIFSRNIKKISIGKVLLIVWMVYSFYSYLMQGEAMKYEFL